MAVYYIYGTSNSGATFGVKGFYSPLYLTQAEANAASANSLGTSHPHTFEEAVGVTFYMPIEDAVHPTSSNQGTAPTGSYSSEAYISYTSPISDIDVQSIDFGVVAGDTFNSWRKKTNDVARQGIANKANVSAVDTQLSRLISVTGGENNIMTLTSSDNITGEKEFEGLVKFTSADDSANAIQVGANGKIYVESSEFKFTKSIDLHTAGGTLKASELDVPTGRTKYANTTYTWPSAAPIPGQILKAGSGNSLNWATETAAEANVEAFLIEDPNPVGSVMLWTEAGAPSKWFKCQGQSLNTFTYKALHAVLNNTYGGTQFAAGTTDQSGAATTFNLPDLRGRVPVGLGEGSDVNGLSAAFNTLGGKTYTSNGATIGGEYQHDITHTITTAEMPQHTHATPYGMLTGNYQGAQQNENAPGYYTGGNFHLGVSALARTTTSAGSSDPLSITTQNVQPFITLNYIIKYEGSSIVEQNITPTQGIQINDSHSQTNLLGASTTPNALGGSSNANTIKLDVNTTDDFKFTSNTLELKTRPLSIDTRLIMGTVRTNANRALEDSAYMNGYVDTNSLSWDGNLAGGADVKKRIYDSEFSDPAVGENNWNNVLPMVFATNVEKTIITAKYNWTGTSGLEEIQFVDIVIDWTNMKINGTSIGNYELGTSSFLPKQTIQTASRNYSFTDLYNGIDHNLRIIINGSTKTISGFPWPRVTGYNTQQGVIKIENHIRG